MNTAPIHSDRPQVLAFVHIQKTAGTTLKFILRNSFGLRHCDTIHTRQPVFTADHYRAARRFFPGLRSLCGHNLVAPTDHLPAEVACFTLLRDPLKRMASHYQDRCVRGQGTISLETWLSDPGRDNLHVRSIAGAPDLEKAKRLLKERYLFAGLVEDFSTSVRLLVHHSKHPINPGYLIRNRATDVTISQKLLNDPVQRAQLENANRLDLELYAYVRDHLFPAAVQALPDTIPHPNANAYRFRTPRERACDLYNKTVWRHHWK